MAVLFRLGKAYYIIDIIEPWFPAVPLGQSPPPKRRRFRWARPSNQYSDYETFSFYAAH